MPRTYLTDAGPAPRSPLVRPGRPPARSGRPPTRSGRPPVRPAGLTGAAVRPAGLPDRFAGRRSVVRSVLPARGGSALVAHVRTPSLSPVRRVTAVRHASLVPVSVPARSGPERTTRGSAGAMRRADRAVRRGTSLQGCDRTAGDSSPVTQENGRLRGRPGPTGGICSRVVETVTEAVPRPARCQNSPQSQP
ncbi:hypothetical protein Sipo8835_33415 [Streptomyces ipomoeae]|uniref:Uncharacterized protein n=1 Tax=Streptomyces ipomoeae TaxID=103232 RepID=A0AAE8VZ01_9ACTN|nr:hypothetical protein Sipo7851_36640 [Streptomyces ipomoeae]TQE24655.1 hypothetical protein Sipo8835_33415 [Streptomyces ipomoeae]